MGIDSEVSPFHLAIPVWNLETCRKFYTKIIGCKVNNLPTYVSLVANIIKKDAPIVGKSV